MGPFATQIAAIMANADNLPPTNALPKISLLDVLLPSQRKRDKKPLDPNVGMRVYREFYDVKKDKKGNPMVVAHKGPNIESDKRGAAGGEDVKKKGGGGKKNEGKQEQEMQKGNEGEQQQGHKIDWTPEQDAKIKSMKAENKSWAEIAEEVGATKGLVKNRFNQIKKEDGGDAGKNKDEAKDSGEVGGKKNKGETQKENKKEKKKSKQEPPKEPAKAPSRVASRNGEARFTMGEWRTLQEDDMFSFGELQCLSELAMRDEQQQWLRIASAFADKTGRRVHPDDIRDKFAEIERMGFGR